MLLGGGLLSLAFHLGLLLLPWPGLPAPHGGARPPLELRLTPPGQVVGALAETGDADPTSPILSDTGSRFERQTVARRGATPARGGGAPPAAPRGSRSRPAGGPAASAASTEPAPSAGELAAPAARRVEVAARMEAPAPVEVAAPADPARPRTATAGAGTPDLSPAAAAAALAFEAAPELPEIADGEVTRINSRASYFAAYARRVRALAGPVWRRAFLEALRDPGVARRFATRRTRRTRLMLTVSSEGRILQVAVRDSCGIWEVDRALADAFRRVRYLPNPPDRLLQPDGRLRFHYVLHLSASP
ncbi:MAG: TonB family protein [Deltaproteobacteria bacterium]|nr:MAG: TonB family protein [Deltaproteobacteria bacterium]